MWNLQQKFWTKITFKKTPRILFKKMKSLPEMLFLQILLENSHKFSPQLYKKTSLAKLVTNLLSNRLNKSDIFQLFTTMKSLMSEKFVRNLLFIPVPWECTQKVCKIMKNLLNVNLAAKYLDTKLTWQFLIKAVHGKIKFFGCEIRDKWFEKTHFNCPQKKKNHLMQYLPVFISTCEQFGISLRALHKKRKIIHIWPLDRKILWKC